MKTRKKLLIALLSATCAASCAFGLAACGNNKDNQSDNHNPDIYAVYQSYVAYAQENSADVMSYEQWLESIKGAQGAQGEKGEDGKSAYQLYCDSVYAADPNATPMTQAQWLASLKGDKGDPGETPIVHEHTYDDNVTTVFSATSQTVGLGYKTCTATDCDHIELVILSSHSYMVYVTDADYKPFAGVKVTINDVTVTTDEEGVAAFDGIESGEYDVIIEKDGYGVLETPNTADDTEIYVKLYPTPVIRNAGYDYFEPVIGDKVGDSATYLITLDFDKDMMWWDQLYAVLTPDESGFATYGISVEGKYYTAANETSGDLLFLDSNYEIVNVSSETSIIFDVYGVGGTYDNPEVTTVSYVVTFTRLETQVSLNGEDNPQYFEAGEELSVESYEHYFKFTAYGDVSYTFEIGEGTALYLRVLDFDTWEFSYEEIPDGMVLEGDWSDYIIKAESTSGNISFTVTASEGNGEDEDPEVPDVSDLTALTLGENEVGYAIYKLEITEASSYTFSGILNGCMVGIEVKSNAYGLYVDPSTQIAVDSEDYDNHVFTFTLEAGTYYVSICEDVTTTLTIAKVAE